MAGTLVPAIRQGLWKPRQGILPPGRGFSFGATARVVFSMVLSMLDALIIGGGPAGLMAPIYHLSCTVSARGAAYRRGSKQGRPHTGKPTILDLTESQVQPSSLGYESRRRSMAPAGAGASHQSAPSFGWRLCCPVEWGGEILVRTALVATGLVDETPNIAGMNPAEVHSGRVRFCPICDGNEALDRRIGVYGSSDEAAKKALFLRTYSRDVTLFETGEKPIPAETLKLLGEAGIRRAGRPVWADCSADATRVIDTTGAATDLDILYPALGCHVRSQLATAIGAVCTPEGNLKVDRDHRWMPLCCWRCRQRSASNHRWDGPCRYCGHRNP
jgi:thioredoxin reductase (NADPH)